MNWKWKEFSSNDQRIIMERTVVALQQRDVVRFSAVLKGFQEIEYSFTENHSVKQAIFAGIVKHFGSNSTNPLSGRELANVICYLGQSRIAWEDIRKDVQDSLFRGISHCSQSFNGQDICNIFHGRVCFFVH
jgi:ADP-dependent phosphofructokinase/glucokinase